MKKRVYLAASAAAASLAAFGLGAGSAHADNINLNTWYTGQFGASNTPLVGGAQIGGTGTNGPVQGGGFAKAVSSPQSPWTITLTGTGTLTVTDVEISGDRFQLWDNGVLMTPASSPFTASGQNPGQTAVGGETSAPVNGDTSVNENINLALGDANYSSGTFALHSGTNSITGEFLGDIGKGDFNFIAESASAVPEPATWAMLLIGFGAVGLLLRSRRREAFAA
jgi:hypothetical protein